MLDKVSDDNARLWYIDACAKNGRSRNVLVHQIESKLYERQALPAKVSNFSDALPPQQSELAQQMMKDPYVFDFIPFRENMMERDVELALLPSSLKIRGNITALFQYSIR